MADLVLGFFSGVIVTVFGVIVAVMVLGAQNPATKETINQTMPDGTMFQRKPRKPDNEKAYKNLNSNYQKEKNEELLGIYDDGIS